MSNFGKPSLKEELLQVSRRNQNPRHKSLILLSSFVLIIVGLLAWQLPFDLSIARERFLLQTVAKLGLWVIIPGIAATYLLRAWAMGVIDSSIAARLGPIPDIESDESMQRIEDAVIQRTFLDRVNGLLFFLGLIFIIITLVKSNNGIYPWLRDYNIHIFVGFYIANFALASAVGRKDYFAKLSPESKNRFRPGIDKMFRDLFGMKPLA